MSSNNNLIHKIIRTRELKKRPKRFKFYLKGHIEPVCILAKNMIEAKERLHKLGYLDPIIAISNKLII